MGLRRTIFIAFATLAIIAFAAVNYQTNAASKQQTAQPTP